jgi:hypothetical protein
LTRSYCVYWLWHDDRPLTAVRLPQGVNPKRVIREAIKAHREHPLTHEPGFEKRLLEATVKTLNP